MRCWILVVLCAGVAAASAAAQVRELKLRPRKASLAEASSSKPLEVRSYNQAVKHFEKEDLAALLKKVDFRKEYVLVYAWIGSSDDHFDYVSLLSYPPQIYFSRLPGRLLDQRAHVRVFLLDRNNVHWKKE